MSSWRDKLRQRAAQNRREIINAKLSRRDLCKLGLLTAGGTLIMKNGLSARAADGGQPNSPPTRPFIAELPIPAVKQPVAALTPAPDVSRVVGEARRDAHQRFNEFPPRKFYDLFEREAPHTFHPDLPANTIWGFDGVFPGPVFHARYGEPVLVRIHNDLPAVHEGFGMPQTSTHLHNGHTASESDGFPEDYYNPGLFKDFHYPNTLAGGDPAEALGFLWYHDHRDGFTAQNVYKGLVGFYILFDDLDSGDENDANPAALRLPSGEFDVPMVFTDRVFDADGQAFFDLFNLDGILGDKFTVNGVIQPFFPVARRKYRLRLLNAGPSRFYEFVFSNGQPFVQISSDGNLLPHPLVRRSIRLGVAERADVVVDFAGAGSNQIFLLNRLEQRNGKGPTGKLLNPGTPILRFDINRDAADPSRVPDTLRPLPVIDPSAVTRKRLWRFDRTNGAWSINGQLFDPEEVRADPKQGVPEIWTLRNNSGDWTHPIHLHMEEFRILSRNTAPIPPEEAGRKDVVRLGPNEEISLFIQFRDFVGRYPMHCHNVVHEDHSMMLRYDVGT